jgi:MFS family permease
MSTTPTVDQPAPPLTRTQWLILIIAAIGFAFDIYELLMMQFVLGPAITELTGATVGSDDFKFWRQMLFWVPMVMGGAVGLIGGYLTDALGRRRMLTWSILIYAFSAFLAGYSTTIEGLLILRCLTLVGVCIEFVAAIAWLAELFPHARQREAMLGYTQAFSSSGGLLSASVFGLLVAYHNSLPAIQIPGFLESIFGQVARAHEPWRYMLMSGVLPALPLIVIRPFLPESPVWERKRQEGTLKRPSFAELFKGELRRTTLVTTLMVACGYGVALGCIQQVPQMLMPVVDKEKKTVTYPLPEVEAAAKEALANIDAQIKDEQAKNLPPEEKKAEITKLMKEKPGAPAKAAQGLGSTAGKIQEVGGLFGRFILAFLAVRFASRRGLLRFFVVPGLIISPLVFGYAAVTNLQFLYIGIFLVGFFTVAQFSFWGNYLPAAYPVHLRGTGESFAANVGGRILGTTAVLLTTQVESFMPADLLGPTKLAYAAACVAGALYLLNLALSFFLPEPGKHAEE